MRAIERETERQRKIDRQTDRQTDSEQARESEREREGGGGERASGRAILHPHVSSSIEIKIIEKPGLLWLPSALVKS